MDKFVWHEEFGYGYYPVDCFVYNKEYFDKYKHYEKTSIGKNILSFRKSVVDPLMENGSVLDVGIGSGFFLRSYKRKSAFGYDVNTTAMTYLKKRKQWIDIYGDSLSAINVITFFDSLEHIQNLERLFDRIHGQHIVISIPIFKDKDHVLRSKHFRIDEHYHYFTHDGFVAYMQSNGFTLKEFYDGEIKAGREDIYTFVFKRYGDY